MKAIQWAGWLTCVLGTLACSGCCNGKGRECDKLVKVINANGEAIKGPKAALEAGKEDPKAVEDLAAVMEKSADQVHGLSLGDESLKGFAKEYEELFRQGAKAMRDMVNAAKARDQAAHNRAVEEAKKIGPSEDALVGRINQYCGP